MQFHQTDQYNDDDDGKRASAASYTLHFELYISSEQMKNVVHCRFSVLSRCHSTSEAGEGTVTEGGSSRYTALGLVCCFFSSGSSVRCHHDVGFSPESGRRTSQHLGHMVSKRHHLFTLSIFPPMFLHTSIIWVKKKLCQLSYRRD